MSEDSKTFTNVSRAQAEKLKSAISAYVTLPDSDTGSIESHGVKGSYAYNETAQTLTLTISEAPFFVPRAMIWSTVERALQD